jgi:hypothetical protein
MWCCGVPPHRSVGPRPGGATSESLVPATWERACAPHLARCLAHCSTRMNASGWVSIHADWWTHRPAETPFRTTLPLSGACVRSRHPDEDRAPFPCHCQCGFSQSAPCSPPLITPTVPMEEQAKHGECRTTGLRDRRHGRHRYRERIVEHFVELVLGLARVRRTRSVNRGAQKLATKGRAGGARACRPTRRRHQAGHRAA